MRRRAKIIKYCFLLEKNGVCAIIYNDLVCGSRFGKMRCGAE